MAMKLAPPASAGPLPSIGTHLDDRVWLTRRPDQRTERQDRGRPTAKEKGIVAQGKASGTGDAGYSHGRQSLPAMNFCCSFSVVTAAMAIAVA